MVRLGNALFILSLPQMQLYIIKFGRFFQYFRLAKGRRIRDSGSSEEDVPPHEEKVLILDYCKTVLISDLIIKNIDICLNKTRGKLCRSL